MARKSNSMLSFFKVLFKDFDRQLGLPPAFVKKYGKFLPENAKIRINSGKTWNVELERMGDEKCCFTRGWADFAEDVALKTGEFVVFRFVVRNSTFDVSVFGTSGCEREISGSISSYVEGFLDLDNAEVKLLADSRTKPMSQNLKSREKEAESDDEQNPDQTDLEVMNPTFKMLMKEHQRSRVSFPKHFVKTADLLRQKAMVMKFPPKKRCWPVVLDHRPHDRVDMAWGWREFWTRNELVLGKTYLFEYIRCKNVIQVRLS